MSELINNREVRRNVLKELISELHDGKSVDDVKAKFQETFGDVSATEISDVEQALIQDGMPVSEVQRLCDVHASVFKGSIARIHAPRDTSEIPGHPVWVLRAENRGLERLVQSSLLPDLARWSDAGDPTALPALIRDLGQLAKVDLHYSKKENVLFPLLEKHDITAPPKVMWGVDDEIRALLKDARRAVDDEPVGIVRTRVELAVDRIREMVFKEENILLPMLQEKLTEAEWRGVARSFAEIGYCLVDRVPAWAEPATEDAAPGQAGDASATGTKRPPSFGSLVMPTGSLHPREIVAMLNALPFDVTFVDKDDTVKYFSAGKERIFARTPEVIGRKVVNCHPPASVHVVQQIVDDFRSGKKDHEDFWIRMGPKFVYIRYFAVRSESGEFLGTLEVTQDIGPIAKLEGEKRLRDQAVEPLPV